MGDVRYAHALDRIRHATDRSAAIRALRDDEIVQALAALAAGPSHDPYLANVLATEAMNRVHRTGTIARTAAEALVSLDNMGRVLHANPATAEILGRPRETLVDVYYHDAIYVVRADGARIPIERDPVAVALETGEHVLRKEVKLQRRSGEVFPVIMSVAPVLRDGQREGVVLTFIDITERKRAEEAVERERKRLYEILDNLSEGVLLVDAEGRYEYANRSAQRILGLTSTQLVGRRTIDEPISAMHLSGQRLPPEQYVSARVLRTGASLRGERMIVRSSTGENAVIELDANPILEPDGKISGVVLSFDDITERLRAEERDHLLASIVEQNVDAILHEDTSGFVRGWNAAAERLLGYARDEMVGRHVSEVIPPDRKDEFANVHARVARGESIPTYDTKRLRKDGTLVDVSVTVSAVRDKEGRITGLAATYRDITRRKAAEDLARAKGAEVEEVMALYAALLRAQGIFHVGYVLMQGTRVVGANEAFAGLVGYAIEELRALPSFMALIHDASEADVLATVARLYQDGAEPARACVALRRKDGAPVRVEVAFQRVPGKESLIAVVRRDDPPHAP